MEVLSSRILVRPSDLDRSLRFYREVLGLAVYREFGPPDHPGVVFFLGQGLLELSGHAAGPAGRSLMIWIQVRDVREERARLTAAGVPVIREPVTEPWGLVEMWIEDPDGTRIVLVEVPAGHPLRRDPAMIGLRNVRRQVTGYGLSAVEGFQLPARHFAGGCLGQVGHEPDRAGPLVDG